MNFTAKIIDDEQDAIQTLSNYLENFPQINLTGTYSDPEEAISAIKISPPDLLFLDIDMPRLDGFDVLKAIGDHPRTHCIFVTAHHEYAIKAIKHNAMDYLLKPVDADEFNETILKVMDYIKRRVKIDYTELMKMLTPNHNRIQVPTGKGIRFINWENIQYLKASGNYTTIFLEKGEKLVAIKKIHEFTESLQPYNYFLRVHNSYTVNLEKVVEYFKDGFLLLSDRSEVPVSRKYKDVLKQELNI